MRLGEAKMAKLICPNCGCFTAFTPVFLTDNEVYDYVLGIKEAASKSDVIKAEFPGFYSGVKYAIIGCQACVGCFVAKETYAKEWHVVYPILSKTVPNEIPSPIDSEFKEASLVFAVGAYRACVAMCQIALEALWRDQRASGLSELKEKDIISGSLYNRANEVRLWGNVAKHEPIPDAVSKEDAEQLQAYLEILLNDVYVEPKRLERLKQKREQVEKKQS